MQNFISIINAQTASDTANFENLICAKMKPHTRDF